MKARSVSWVSVARLVLLVLLAVIAQRAKSEAPSSTGLGSLSSPTPAVTPISPSSENKQPPINQTLLLWPKDLASSRTNTHPGACGWIAKARALTRPEITCWFLCGPSLPLFQT